MSKKKNINLELWDAVCVTPKEKTKDVTFKVAQYTTVNPQYQIRCATAQFGSLWRYLGI